MLQVIAFLSLTVAIIFVLRPISHHYIPSYLLLHFRLKGIVKLLLVTVTVRSNGPLKVRPQPQMVLVDASLQSLIAFVGGLYDRGRPVQCVCVSSPSSFELLNLLPLPHPQGFNNTFPVGANDAIVKQLFMTIKPPCARSVRVRLRVYMRDTYDVASVEHSTQSKQLELEAILISNDKLNV